MLFLILSGLLGGAFCAGLGAWLAHWWFRRSYEDVTTEYDRLTSLTDRVDLRKMGIATRDDLNMVTSRLQEDVKSFRPADLTPLQERLIRLEQYLSNLRVPEPNLNPLHERFARIESRLAQPDPGHARLVERLMEIEKVLGGATRDLTALRQIDLSPVQSRLDRIENAIHAIDLPEGDLSGVHNALAQIQLTLEEVDARLPSGEVDLEPFRRTLGETEFRLADFVEQRETSRKSDFETLMMRMQTLQSGLSALRLPDMQPLADRLARIENSVSASRAVDLSPVQDRLARIEYLMDGLTVPQDQLAPVEDRLARIEYGINNIRIPETDFMPLDDRLARLEYAVTSIRPMPADLAPVEDALARLDYTVANFRVPQTDLTPVEERLGRIEYAVNAIRLPEFNLTPFDDRLRSIEAQLRAPNDDFRVVTGRIADLERGTAALLAKLVGVENAVAGLDRAQIDLGPLSTRVMGIDTALNALRGELRSMPDLAPIERRLAAVQDTVASLRETDLTPVIGTLRKIDSALDFRALENRLTSIEYGLAAMHDMLRSRGLDSRPPSDARMRTPAPRTDDNGPYDTRSIPPRTQTRTANPPPPRPSDPLMAVRRTNDRANLLTHDAFGPGDDLEQILGVGPLLKELLNDLGVYYFWQIAEWGPREVEWVDSKLEHFKGRITRDTWIDQARQLMRQANAARRPA
jgi:predicted flap endonuclease-1-like 5' DNA nuclease